MNDLAIGLPSLSTPLVLGLELVGLAVVLVIGSRAITTRFPRAASSLALVRTLALVGGIAVIALTFVGDPTPETDVANPVAATVTSVTAGAELFRANCAACHGTDGTGSGPDAGTTPIRPANLRSGHLATHTDGDIHYWIGAGLQGGMPGFAARLSDADRWNLVNYLRSLNGIGPTPVAAGIPGGSPPAASPGLLLPPIAAAGALAWVAGARRRRPASKRATPAARVLPSVVMAPVAARAVPDHLGPHSPLEAALWVLGTLLVAGFLWWAYGRSRPE